MLMKKPMPTSLLIPNLAGGKRTDGQSCGYGGQDSRPETSQWGHQHDSGIEGKPSGKVVANQMNDCVADDAGCRYQCRRRGIPGNNTDLFIHTPIITLQCALPLHNSVVATYRALTLVTDRTESQKRSLNGKIQPSMVVIGGRDRQKYEVPFVLIIPPLPSAQILPRFKETKNITNFNRFCTECRHHCQTN